MNNIFKKLSFFAFVTVMWCGGGFELEENTSQIYSATMWAEQRWEVRKTSTDKQTNRFGLGTETDYYGNSRKQQTTSGGFVGHRQIQQQKESVEVIQQPFGFGGLRGIAGPSGYLGQPNQGGQWSNGPGGSISPGRVQRIYRHILTPYEELEILAYPEIYFIGGERAAKIPGTDARAANQGYDDANGSYHTTTHDHIAYRYEVLRVLGKGAFGQVVKAFDHKMQEYVAIKVVRNNEKFKKQAMCEVKILEHLLREDKNNEGNVVHVKDSFMFRGHVCIVFELLSNNLYEVRKEPKI